ncbi:MAG TPA: hypothetical protein VNK41_06300 [Vicinamibacterales bacterium]|nr:hypothetical protein [Vicinamibacterales bacterium]
MRVDRRLLRAVVILLVLLVGVVLSLPHTLPRGVRSRLVAALSERFDSRVELQDLRVSVLPRLRVEGGGLVLRHKGRTDVPPLIAIRSFSAEAGLAGLIGRPLRVRHVRLEGMEISIPPGGMSLDKADAAREKPVPTGTAGEAHARGTGGSPLIVDNLTSTDAILRLLRSTPGKAARVFTIHHLSMEDVGAEAPWSFRATLTNPTPPGEIETGGRFGPWNAPQPSQTSLEGTYTFSDADLGVFDGIAGTLTSTGRFTGVLERIEVDGKASVPDFALPDVGQPVALETTFHSIVDGTSGNTWLRPVNASFGRTEIRADGGIVEREGDRGRTISLDVVIEEGRIEDILRLVSKAKTPPMVGALALKAKFTQPPGRAKVIDRIELDGSFQIARAQFTKRAVQGRVDQFSRMATPGEDQDPERVASNFTGRFTMRDGIIRIPRVTFIIPGARVDVNGAYRTRGQALNFEGTVRTEAKLSQMTTGVKSTLLKIVDPLFRREDRTVIPVTVEGTVDQPKVRLDVGRTLRRD